MKIPYSPCALTVQCVIVTQLHTSITQQHRQLMTWTFQRPSNCVKALMAVSNE